MSRFVLVLLAVVGGITWMTASHAHALGGGNQWLPNGNPLCAAPRGQTQPALCPDGDGGAFVAWEDSRGPNYDRVFLTHVLGNGAIATGWPVNGLGVSNEVLGVEHGPILLADGRGGAYIAWDDYRTLIRSASYLQRLTGSGETVPGWPVNGLEVDPTVGDGGSIALLPHPTDGVIVFSLQSTIYEHDVLRAQHVLSSGIPDPAWPHDGRSLVADVSRALVFADGTGGFYVSSATGSYPDPLEWRVAHFTSEGLADPAWPSSGVAACTGCYVAAVVPDGAGGCLLTVAGRFEDRGIWVRRLDGAGSPAPAWPTDGVAITPIPGVDASFEDVVTDGAGGTITTYYVYGDPDHAFVQRVKADGTRPSGWSPMGSAVCTAPCAPELEALVSDSQGGALIVWKDSRSGDLTDVYAQRIGPDGAPVPGWPSDGLPVCTDPNDQDLPRITPDGAHGAIVAWRDFRPDENPPQFQSGNIYAARVFEDGVTEVQASVIESFAAPEAVRIVWLLARGGGAAVRVERTGGGESWVTRATLIADAQGHVAYEDRDVVAGSRYGYRMAVEEGGVSRALGEIWVDVPAASGLVLHGLVPNPARGAIVASFSLPDRAPGRLELFDAAGRRVLWRDVSSAGPGSHRLRLVDAGGLRPGVYLLSLTHGESRLTRRVSVVN